MFPSNRFNINEFLWKGGNLSNGHRKLLDSLTEEEKRPSETAERSALGAQGHDQALRRRKRLPPKSLAAARMLPRVPRRVPGGPALQKGESALIRPTAPARTSLSRRKTQNPRRMKGVRKRGHGGSGRL